MYTDTAARAADDDADDEDDDMMTTVAQQESFSGEEHMGVSEAANMRRWKLIAGEKLGEVCPLAVDYGVVEAPWAATTWLGS